MYQRYYDGYDVDQCTHTPSPCTSIADNSICETTITPSCHTNKSPFPAGDDILLIGVLILLLHEECNDTALILIIGFLLFSGFIS